MWFRCNVRQQCAYTADRPCSQRAAARPARLPAHVLVHYAKRSERRCVHTCKTNQNNHSEDSRPLGETTRGLCVIRGTVPEATSMHNGGERGQECAFLKTYLHEHFRRYCSMSAFLQLSIEIPAHEQRFHELHAINCMPSFACHDMLRPPAPPRICAHTHARARTRTTTRSLSRTLTCRKRRAHAELLYQYHQTQSPVHVGYSQRCYIHCFCCTQTSERGARCVDLRFQESP